MSNKNVIIFDDVRYCYGEVCAIQNVSFSIKEKTLTVLIGPNGGGKSTIIKLITGLLKPGKGNIVPEESAAIGYVAQNPWFDVTFPMTVNDMVLTGTLNHKVKLYNKYTQPQKQKALDAIELVGLNGFENREISQLSGGQLKRAVIARALSSNAEIIVLDEPDSSLDAKSTQELYEFLNQLKKDKTIIIASHHIHNLFDIADSVIYINNEAQEYASPIELEEKLKGGMAI
ncbi:MAG: ABC transporter ATP-binding protein [Clostridiales bacterium]|nr:ABC transporter ATP-binding protein [Clostridiales bacterium]